jgi:HK97 family phage prohead protease
VTDTLDRIRSAEEAGGLTVRTYSVTGVELRAPAEGSTKALFTGHASIYNHGYEMYGGPVAGGWTEFVDTHAGAKTLSEKPDVAFLINHGGMTLARTKPGTLRLAEDQQGLAVDADLDVRVSAVNDLSILMADGNMDEMSFAFRTIRQVWLNAEGEEVPWWDLDGIERHIQEYSLHKGDVSAVNYGANDATFSTMRDRDLAFVEVRAAALGLGRPAFERQLQDIAARNDGLRIPSPKAPAGMTLAEARLLASR